MSRSFPGVPARSQGAPFWAATRRGMKMRALITGAMLGAALVLAGCGGDADDSAAENVEQAAENESENLEAIADNMTNDAAADAVENRAEAVEDAGEEKADQIDDNDNSAAASNVAGM